MNKKFHAVLKYGICISILVLFCYFRLKPILLQTVGYTFDQGRDFLKAAEIVLYRNPTFIGPTTGIGGIFHGAWWYYILSFAFILFRGLPIGFYITNILIQSLAAYLFFRFTKLQFGFLTGVILTALIATSGHFIFTSIFIGNNVLAIPSVLLMSISTLLFLQGKERIHLNWINRSVPTTLFMGLGLGFIAEFEFAFGLMVIPSYFTVMTIIFLYRYVSIQRSFPDLKRRLILFLSGLAFPFFPRLLFELKNHFPQTRVLMNFIIHPSYHTPKPYHEIVHDRLLLFQGYYYSLFISDYVRIVVTITILVLFVSLLVKRKYKPNLSCLFLAGMIICLYLFSTWYKDTFWAYYYDGIQVLMLLLIGYLIPKPVHASQTHQFIKICLLVFILSAGVLHMKADLRSHPTYDGLRVQKDIVSYIHALERPNAEYCVQIYTPPVIPYTYQYLFLYAHYSHGIPQPKDTWIKKQCWFILEFDDNKERKLKWITDHVPEKALRLSHKKFKDVSVELWKLGN